MGHPKVNIGNCISCKIKPAWARQMCRICYKRSYYEHQKAGNRSQFKSNKRSKKTKEPTDLTVAHIISSYKRHAKERNFTWNLSKEQVKKLIFQHCEYCNSLPANISCHYAKNDIRYQAAFALTNGIDRIDNTIGYELSNVCTCCKICNRAKSDMSHIDFIAWLKQIGVKYGNQSSRDQRYSQRTWQSSYSAL